MSGVRYLKIYLNDSITDEEAHDLLDKWCPWRRHWWQIWRKKPCPWFAAVTGYEGDDEAEEVRP